MKRLALLGTVAALVVALGTQTASAQSAPPSDTVVNILGACVRGAAVARMQGATPAQAYDHLTACVDVGSAVATEPGEEASVRGALDLLVSTAYVATQAAQTQPRTQLPTDVDVILDVPNLRVEEISLTVRRLSARINLDARAAGLVTLTAGVDVSIDEVNLTIRGVQAELYLRVDLDNIRAIVERVLQTLDSNPQIVQQLLNSVGGLVGQVGQTVSQTVGALTPALTQAIAALGPVLSQTVNTLGQAVVRTIDATGNIVERTLDQAGTTLGTNTVGNISSLPVLSETTNQAGQIVRRLQDTGGSVIEVVLDQAGRVVSSRVVSGATGGR